MAPAVRFSRPPPIMISADPFMRMAERWVAGRSGPVLLAGALWKLANDRLRNSGARGRSILLNKPAVRTSVADKKVWIYGGLF